MKHSFSLARSLAAQTRIIELTHTELWQAEQIGLQRIHESGDWGLDPTQSEGERSYYHRLVDELSGAAAERAWAKYLNTEHEARLNTFKAVADVGSEWEVRSSSIITNDSCIVRDHEPADRWYVFLLTDAAPVFKIYGKIWGRDAKQLKYRRNPHGKRPAYFVPPEHLLPVD